LTIAIFQETTENNEAKFDEFRRITQLIEKILGEHTMTTQTQEAKIKQANSTLLMKKTHIWPLVLAAFLILAIIGGAIVVSQPRGEEFVRNRRALESISARYQGMADLYTAREKAETQRALEIISSRYKGMADLFAAREKAETQRALESISSRYQGQADLYTAWEKAETIRVLKIISARYQAQAEMYQAQED